MERSIPIKEAFWHILGTNLIISFCTKVLNQLYRFKSSAEFCLSSFSLFLRRSLSPFVLLKLSLFFLESQCFCTLFCRETGSPFLIIIRCKEVILIVVVIIIFRVHTQIHSYPTFPIFSITRGCTFISIFLIVVFIIILSINISFIGTCHEIQKICPKNIIGFIQLSFTNTLSSSHSILVVFFISISSSCLIIIIIIILYKIIHSIFIKCFHDTIILFLLLFLLLLISILFLVIYIRIQCHLLPLWTFIFRSIKQTLSQLLFTPCLDSIPFQLLLLL
mmetsp:Transcript_6754/g.12711  ORF Transcript_6754/g.12711 Transcript_6754/m.12711 type:complete len:277 (-) Transcript_6754:764-1594(-)